MPEEEIQDGGEVGEEAVETQEGEAVSEDREDIAPDSDEPQGASESEKGEDEVQYTQKGTKLDPDPLSAAHQQLANEKRVRQQYEQVLRDPKALRRYMEDSGFTQKEIQEEQEKRFSPDQIKTAEDLTNALNELTGDFDKRTKAYEEKIQALENTIGGFGQVRRVEAVASKMRNDAETIRDKYPELDPKSSDYDQELDKAVTQLYHQMDYDPRSGSYTGRHSLANVADQIMTAAQKAQKKASKDAQTRVKERQAGKVVTSKKPSKDTSKSSDPATEIARRINKAING